MAWRYATNAERLRPALRSRRSQSSFARSITSTGETDCPSPPPDRP